MEPQVLLEKKFFDCFGNIKNQKFNIFGPKNNIYFRINELRNIIENSNLYIDFEENIIDYLKTKDEGEVPKDPFKMFLKFAINNNARIFSNKRMNFDSGYIYLKNDSKTNCTELEKERGIRVIGKEYDFLEEIFPPSFSDFDCSDEMVGPGFDKLQHTTKNLVYIDPYFFSNWRDKEHNFFKLVRHLIPKECINPHISIIAGGSEAYSKGESYFEKIISNWKNELGHAKLNVSLYLPHKDLFRRNRYFITDYCTGALQHLLDRNGGISGNYLYTRDINENYRELTKKTEKIKVHFKKNQGKKFGIYPINYGNILDNPILK